MEVEGAENNLARSGGPELEAARRRSFWPFGTYTVRRRIFDPPLGREMIRRDGARGSSQSVA